MLNSLNSKIVSPLFHQNKKGSLLKRIIPLSIIIGLLICYRYFVEITYEVTSIFVPTVPNVPNISIINLTNINDDIIKFDPLITSLNDDINIDPLSTKEPEYKFRVKVERLKPTYQVMDIIRIIIEPRHPSLARKLESSFFRVTITGTTIFTPQLISHPNSPILIYEAPLMDQGIYKMQARIIFYDYPDIYSFESSNIPNRKLSLKSKIIDRIIVNGEFIFNVEQQSSTIWDRFDLPDSCSDISILRGRWNGNLSKFIPYSCNIPNHDKISSILESNLNFNKGYPKFIDYNNLPFRYNWIRFLGDSNTRRIFHELRKNLGTSCVYLSDGQNKDKNTHFFCSLNYTQTQFLGKNDPRPRKLYLTYEWYHPESKYNLITLLNNTFEQTCKPHDKCLRKTNCDFMDKTLKGICSTKRADYTFISIGSHTPGWNDKSIDKYLERIFQQIHQNYQEKITFITTNAADMNKIPIFYKNQNIIRNNFRIRKANELLKKHVDKSQKDGYSNIDLLDFFGTTYPIYEHSEDAVHYGGNVYNEQNRLVLDRLINNIKTLN